MEIQPLDRLTKIINDALNGTTKLHKSFKTFFVTTSILFLSMAKRKICTQMALFSDCSECRFRQNFRKKFDWVRYNLAYCREKLRHRIAIAIDTSYIPKSGVEYLYLDAKQFTGLTHCQSRKRESLDFAFNMSLSSINVASFFPELRHASFCL